MEQRGRLITILQKIQAKEGYLSKNSLAKVFRETGIPLSEIYSVATFYSQFHLEKRGRNIIKVCRGTACHVKGGRSILRDVEKELGVTDGGTTEDYAFTLETVACLGACFLAPAMMINGDYYGKLNSDKAVSLIKAKRKS